MYEFTPLISSTISPYNSFIPEKIQSQLTTLTPDIKLIAFGATLQGTPIGLSIALLNTTLHLLDILHIEVEKEHRNHHVGRELLAKTQDAAIKMGAKTFSFIYALDQPETPAIEKIFNANGWEGSRPFLIRALFDLVAFDAPLLHLKYNYSAGYQEFLWKDLKKSQRLDLLYREEQGHFSHAISPFSEDKSLELSNSLGLQCNDRVVGWMITHRTDPDTVCYTSLYIEPSLKFKGLSMKLLADSILLHKQHPTKWALIEIPYLQVHPSWLRLIKRHLLPYAFKVTYLQQGWHTI